MCRPHFPENTDFTPPPVSVVVMQDRDGRGYIPVIMDASWWLDYKPDLMYTLGHETFHHIHNRIMRVHDEDFPEDSLDLFWVVRQTQQEGIADQVGGVLHTQYSTVPKEHIEEYAARVRGQEAFYSGPRNLDTKPGSCKV